MIDFSANLKLGYDLCKYWFANIRIFKIVLHLFTIRGEIKEFQGIKSGKFSHLTGIYNRIK